PGKKFNIDEIKEEIKSDEVEKACENLARTGYLGTKKSGGELAYYLWTTPRTLLDFFAIHLGEWFTGKRLTELGKDRGEEWGFSIKVYSDCKILESRNLIVSRKTGRSGRGGQKEYCFPAKLGITVQNVVTQIQKGDEVISLVLGPLITVINYNGMKIPVKLVLLDNQIVLLIRIPDNWIVIFSGENFESRAFHHGRLRTKSIKLEKTYPVMLIQVPMKIQDEEFSVQIDREEFSFEAGKMTSFQVIDECIQEIGRINLIIRYQKAGLSIELPNPVDENLSTGLGSVTGDWNDYESYSVFSRIEKIELIPAKVD
ncbi:MAG: hypothetical protein ACFFD4_39030, partial [Candidatus Odinarchaeota archaeon]